MLNERMALAKDEIQGNVVRAVLAERTVQDMIWGGREHDKTHDRTEWADLIHERTEKLLANRKEFNLYTRHLIEIAALAIAALEVDDGFED